MAPETRPRPKHHRLASNTMIGSSPTIVCSPITTGGLITGDSLGTEIAATTVESDVYEMAMVIYEVRVTPIGDI